MRKLFALALVTGLIFSAAPVFAGGSGCSYAKNKTMTAKADKSCGPGWTEMVVRLETSDWAKADKTLASLKEKHEGLKKYSVQQKSGALWIGYDSEKLEGDTLKAALKDAGDGVYKISMPKVVTKSIKVDGMTCGGCVKTLRAALQDVDGFAYVKVDLESGKTDIMMFEDKVSDKKIAKAVKKAGFKVTA